MKLLCSAGVSVFSLTSTWRRLTCCAMKTSGAFKNCFHFLLDSGSSIWISKPLWCSSIAKNASSEFSSIKMSSSSTLLRTPLPLLSPPVLFVRLVPRVSSSLDCFAFLTCPSGSTIAFRVNLWVGIPNSAPGLSVGISKLSSHSASFGRSCAMSTYVLRFGSLANWVIVQGRSMAPFSSSTCCSNSEAFRSCSGAALMSLPALCNHTMFAGLSSPSSCRVSVATTRAGPRNFPLRNTCLSLCGNCRL